MKWEHKIIIGLETLKAYVEKHPEADAAMAELFRQVRHPFDPTESDQIRPNPTYEPHTEWKNRPKGGWGRV